MAIAKFVQGSILRHILVMSSTAAIGISALFVVDLLDIFFLSLLGEQELAAAVGYAGTISFFTTSIGIGLSIALGALVSRAIGAKEIKKAKRLLLNSAVVTLLVSIVVAIIVFVSIPQLLALVGATGRTEELAASYLYILVPSMPLICLAMALGSALRAVGDAKLSMISTLVGGGVNAIFDPIFIFMFAMGIQGAAIASVLARIAVLIVAARGVILNMICLANLIKRTLLRTCGLFLPLQGRQCSRMWPRRLAMQWSLVRWLILATAMWLAGPYWGGLSQCRLA